MNYIKGERSFLKPHERDSFMNNALKFLLLAAGCALVVLLITVGVKTANKGKENTNGNLDQYSKMASNYDDIELKVYEGTEVLGKEVKSLIHDLAGDDFISIRVINGKVDTEDYIHTPSISSSSVVTGIATVTTAVSNVPSAGNYINDSGTFLCDVLYDQNDVVACLRFTQQK